MSDQYLLPCFMLIGNLIQMVQIIGRWHVDNLYVGWHIEHITWDVYHERWKGLHNIPSIGECRCHMVIWWLQSAFHMILGISNPSISHDTHLKWYVQCATRTYKLSHVIFQYLDHLDRLPISMKQGRRYWSDILQTNIYANWNISIRRGNFILISAINNIAILEATVKITNFCSDLDSLQKMGLDTSWTNLISEHFLTTSRLPGLPGLVLPHFDSVGIKQIKSPKYLTR